MGWTATVCLALIVFVAATQWTHVRAQVDGQWGTWGVAVPGACSVLCGGGTRPWTRTRACNNPAPQNNGRFCVGSSTLSGTEPCETDPCPVHGQWGPWGARVDEACSVSCGSGSRPWTRRRVCDNPRPENDGNDCVGSAVETGTNPCTEVACPICRRVTDIVIVQDGSFSIGDNVFATSVKTALQGLTTKLFAFSTKVSMGLVLFSHALDANISMTTDISGYRSGIVGLPYPAGGTFTWLGIKAGAQMIYQLNRQTSSTKLMIVITDGESANTALTAEEARLAKSNGIVIYAVGVGQATVSELMAIASSPDKVIRVANFDDLANQLLNISINCPIDGQWGPWGAREDGDCSVSCGSGIRPWTRRRACDSPRPENDGNDCVGSAVETGTNPCAQFACGIDGAWSFWTILRMDPCDVTCGTGNRLRVDTRTCDNPAPTNKGKYCEGSERKTVQLSCDTQVPCSGKMLFHEQLLIRFGSHGGICLLFVMSFIAIIRLVLRKRTKATESSVKFSTMSGSVDLYDGRQFEGSQGELPMGSSLMQPAPPGESLNQNAIRLAGNNQPETKTDKINV
ncbi:coadhesin-like [Gigantopelta aegis]|uniref:coadhesin-like n=1 Tax=Gigantopelta aegis TaxID=1735272 RepID=UPI001B88A384|nr:coadhesin-like [Gigantopelta aegis]